MAKIAYIEKRFQPKSLAIIEKAEEICEDYSARGFSLTLRQLYYRFVAGGLIPNRDTEYERLGSIINDARLAGLIDWEHITDRTRGVEGNSHWGSPAEIIQSALDGYQRDKWDGQPFYVEVWVEKDALKDVIGQTASRLDVRYFSCRGYTSVSEIWTAAQRIRRECMASYYQGKPMRMPVILHLGDHDPSGIDMTRDVTDRVGQFLKQDSNGRLSLEVRRLALNMDQVDLYDPPPNPAKLSDSRAAAYVEKYGDESWELDALDPAVLAELITDAIADYRDDALYEAVQRRERSEKVILRQTSARWEEVAKFLTDTTPHGGLTAPGEEDDDDDDTDA